MAKFSINSLFWLYDATCSILVIMMIAFAFLSSRRKKESKPDKKLGTALLRERVGTPHGALFFVNLLLFGIAASLLENYLFLFLLEEFDATTVLCGLTIAVMCIAEMPVFYWSEVLIDKIGILGLLSLAHCAYIVRCVGYTLLPQSRYYSWFILFIEPLHGITYAGMWVASVEYGARLAPQSLRATMQGLVSGTYFGLANCSGAVIGGVLFHRFGPVWMFRMAAAFVTGWMFFFQFAMRMIRCYDDGDGIKMMFSENIEEKNTNLEGLRIDLVGESNYEETNALWDIPDGQSETVGLLTVNDNTPLLEQQDTT